MFGAKQHLGLGMNLMVRVLLIFLAIMVSVGLVACEAWPGTGGRGVEAGEVAKSKKERVTSPAVGQGDLAALVRGNSGFALDLYQALREEEGNLFFSPYSISAALAMTYAGARSETEKQMAETLHFVLGQDDLHPAFNALELELARRSEVARGDDAEGFRLEVANSIWGQKGFTFVQEFLDVLAENYGAGLRLLDFGKDPEESRQVINEWVSDKTEGKIEDLVPKGLLDELTRLVLANAIYFNAPWESPFEEDDTEEGGFRLLGGGEVRVPMMHQEAHFGYGEGEGYQAVELAYYGGQVSMVIVVPEAGRFREFEAGLDADRVAAIVSDLEWERIRLIVPRFEFESEIQLAEVLAEMGMPTAFSSGADFTGISATGGLFIKEVVHKAFVSVDEAGTEAAAATMVLVPVSAPVGEPKEVRVNRPFVFMIRDRGTGSILFVGRVVDPTA